MGTEINVTTGPLRLLQQSRQQVETNRLQRAEQDAQRRTQAAATQARQQELDRLGLTADGQQRYGDPLQARFRRQKPAAFRFGGGGFLIAPRGSYTDGLLPVQTSAYAPMVFSKFATVDDFPSPLPFANFSIAAGPATGTQALAPAAFTAGLGYTFISSFPGDTPLDMKEIGDAANSQNNYIDFAFSRPDGLYSGIPKQPLPDLIHPTRSAANFDSFTFEFIAKAGPENMEISLNNSLIRIEQYIYNTDLCLIAFRLSGAKDVSPRDKYYIGDIEYDKYILSNVEQVWVDAVAGEPEYDGLYVMQIPQIELGTWFHVALSKQGNTMGAYVNGTRIFTVTTGDDYWDRYCVRSYGPPQGIPSYSLLYAGDLPIIAKAYSVSDQAGGLKTSVHGMRFTPRALYTTPTITPPTSITALA